MTLPSLLASPQPVATRRFLASVSLRCLAMAGLLVAAAVTGRGHNSTALLAYVGIGLVILALDRRNLFTMRNFFLVYTVALFTLGVPLFDLPPRLYGDMILYLVAFLVGYTFGSLRRAAPPRAAPLPDERADVSLKRIAVMEEAMLILAFLQIVLLAYQISRYGLKAFYSGQPLIDQLTTYGKASVSSGLVQAITFLLKYSAIAVVIIYAQSSLQAGVKIYYRYPLLLLVLVPIASLARSDALHGAGMLLVLSAADRRIAVRLPQLTARGATSRRQHRRVLAFGSLAVVALLAGLVIGSLRQSKLAPTDSPRSALERSLPFFQSELTPIRAYSEIQENAAVLGRQHGATIVPPLILKVVPRGVFPGKPLNSGAYYMSVVRPSEFAAGFAVPPTLFGDAQLNFGFGGVVLACLAVGAISARLDVAYREPRLSRLPWFLIVFVNYYSLLRSPLSETLAGVLLTSIAFLALRHVLRGRALPGPTQVRPRSFGEVRRPTAEIRP